MSDAGLTAWRVIEGCQSQVRATERGPYGWDFGAVLTFAALLGADLELVASLLPHVEPLVVHAHSPEDRT